MCTHHETPRIAEGFRAFYKKSPVNPSGFACSGSRDGGKKRDGSRKPVADLDGGLQFLPVECLAKATKA
jgi:hypothetical protein